MSLSITIPNDSGLRVVRALVRGLVESRWQPVVEEAAADSIRDHLAKAESGRPNKMGWPRQHWWAKAARSVSSARRPGMVTVSIAQLGFRQRLEGGVIRAGRNISSKTGQPTQWLAIPARAEAYGKRPGEFGNLKFTRIETGGFALVAATGGATRQRKIKGQIRAAVLRGAEEGLVMFWLRRSVRQKPDPTVLPTEQAMFTMIHTRLDDFFQALVDRAFQP